MAMPVLLIGNKKYSSWSLRAWIGLKQLGIPFKEHRVALFTEGYKQEILKHNPAGKVPALIVEGLVVYESIAILEYLNETLGQDRLLPKDIALRARIRSVCAEMHAGFASLRKFLPMNLARRRGPVPLNDDTRADIKRILTLWEGLRDEFKDAGPYLFGAWSMADCMYLPVCTRFDTYQVDLTLHPRARGYVETMLALPAFLEWRKSGIAEHEVIPEDEV
jgi:glutathione S-transferase